MEAVVTIHPSTRSGIITIIRKSEPIGLRPAHVVAPVSATVLLPKMVKTPDNHLRFAPCHAGSLRCRNVAADGWHK